MATNFVRNNPSVTAALEKNVLEHISLMAQEQVQLEFQQEFQMLPQLQQAATQNPQVRQQLQQISQKIEARKAVLIADMTEEFMKEEKTITSQFDHDPLLKLKQREVDLKAIEEERKIKEDDARINLDKTKLLQGQQLAKEKLQQNEELANLRADTSIEKSLISADVKLTSDQMKAKDVKTLKGPRS
jgi:transcriptional regulator NrdR family protein